MYLDEEIKVVPMIGSIEIKDEGIIKEAKIKFDVGLNIIKGPNASGKTTVIKEIEKQAGHVTDLEGLKALSAASERIMLPLIGITKTPYFNKCFLIDDIFARLSKDKAKIFLKELEKTKNQIIMTMNSYIKIKTKANIIDTKDFKLKKNRSN